MTTAMEWYELVPPRGIDLATVAAMVRPLASRPRLGWRHRTPLVVFEQWQINDRCRYLIGLETPLGQQQINQLKAAMPGLVALSIDASMRPPVNVALDIRLSSVSSVIRTDVAAEVSTAVASAMNTTPTGTVTYLQWVIGPSQSRVGRPPAQSPAVTLGIVAPPVVNAQDERDWRTKAGEPLFAVLGRVGTTASPAVARHVAAGIRLADSQRGHIRIGAPSRHAANQFNRVRTSRFGGIFSAAEVATVLAWPITGTEHARTAILGDVPPHPASRGRHLGAATHPAVVNQPVVLPESALSRGVYVIGPTGSGKSELLLGMALDDVALGRALVVIEPKVDLSQAIMEQLPAGVPVVYINPAYQRQVIGSSVMAGPTHEAERRADELVSLFLGLHGTALGPRSTDVLLHAALMVARWDGGTLVDIPALLTRPNFREHIAREVGDPLVITPWLNRFHAMSDGERAQVVGPLLNKLQPFVARAGLRRIFGQSESTWTWESILDHRGVVLVSLNRGAIGGEATRLAGALLLHSLWAAIQRRNTRPASERPPATIIVDEAQQFLAGLDLADVLSTIRSTNVSMTIAHQDLSQLTPALRAAVAANARSKVVFKPAPDDTATLARWLDSPQVTADDLASLPMYTAIARWYGDDGAFHVATKQRTAHLREAETAIAASQRVYGRSGTDIDEALLSRWGADAAATDLGIGVVPRGGRS
ncbi:hypothetical protein TSOC111612_00870 [Tsukamurella ocularis]|uniref:type IV secretory system conjugative DNA transfer family protein n=1 Tax=Tsukamurella ocularis TaxID=1970234 RepID=UPI0039F0DCCD